MMRGQIGLSVLGILMLALCIGCDTQRNTKQPSSSQSGTSVQRTPSQAGSAGQQGSMSGESPMEHDKGGDRIMK